MNWFKKILSTQCMPEDIQVGDCIINKEEYPEIGNMYFYKGSREVIRICKAPEYAGGKFVFVKFGNKEQGFYINSIKKVQCS